MKYEVKYWYLKNHKFFDNLKEEEYIELCVVGNFKTGKRNELIYFSDSDRIFFLKKGVIKILSLDSEGNEITQDVLYEGDLFGELSLNQETTIKGVAQFARVISDEVSVCSFTLDSYKQLMAKNPNHSFAFTKIVGDKVKSLEIKYKDLIFKDVQTRLREFLKNYALKNGIQTDNNQIVVTNLLTQNDIACLIGATRQTVVSMLTALEKEKLIEYSRKEIKINDIHKL